MEGKEWDPKLVLLVPEGQWFSAFNVLPLRLSEFESAKRVFFANIGFRRVCMELDPSFRNLFSKVTNLNHHLLPVVSLFHLDVTNEPHMESSCAHLLMGSLHCAAAPPPSVSATIFALFTVPRSCHRTCQPSASSSHVLLYGSHQVSFCRHLVHFSKRYLPPPSLTAFLPDRRQRVPQHAPSTSCNQSPPTLDV